MGIQYSNIQIEKNDLLDIVARSIINISNDCSTNSTQSQNIDISNVKDVEIVGVDMSQKSTLNISCIQKIEKNIDTSTKIMQDIITQIENKLSGQNIGGQISNSSEIQNIVVNLVNELNYDSITNCIGTFVQVQDIKVSDSENVKIANTNFEQSIDIIKNCIQQDNTVLKNVIELEQTLKTTASSSVEGFLNMETLIVIAVILVIIIILILVIKSFKSSASNGTQDYYRPPLYR